MSRRAPAPPPKPSSSTARTVVLVAVVAAIAALVLSRGFGNKDTGGTASGASTGGSTTKTTKASKGGTTTVDTTPVTVATTIPPTIPAASLKVVVLNGSKIAGTAGKRAADLKTLGYALAVANNAEQEFPTSAVYYVGAEVKDSANVLAAKMNLTAAPAPATDTGWVKPENIAGQQVIVLLGKDKANTPIVNTPGAAPTTVAGAGLTPKPATTATTVKA